MADLVLEKFYDSEQGGFFYTADDHEKLIARTKDLHDSSVPSGNSMAATALLRLGRLCGRGDYLETAEETLQLATGIMENSPSAAGQMLIALDMHLGPMPEIVVLGDAANGDTRDALAELRRRFAPNRVLACRRSTEDSDGSSPLQAIFEGKSAAGQEPTVFLCENFTCQAPISGRKAAIAAWDKL